MTTPDPIIDEGKTSNFPTYGTIVTGIVLVILGTVWLLDAADLVSVRLTMVVPIALAVVGLALIVGSFRGQHPGLVTLGVFLTIATLLISFVPAGFRGGIGDREITVTQESQLEERYDLALGKLTLDLSGLEMTESATIAMSVGAGEIQVRMPPDIPFRVEASVGAGEVLVLDEASEGLLPTHNYTSPGFDTAPVTLTLNVNVGAGKVEVR